MIRMKLFLDDILQHLNNQNFGDVYDGFMINTGDLVFEERVKMNCYYCGKFNNNWRCPPNLPKIDYKRMFDEFDNCACIYVKIPFNCENYNEVRTESSVILHKGMLEAEKLLWNNNNSTALSFIGGSCKLCKNKCGIDKCNNPSASRTPVEATGINIVKTLEKYDFHIVFPPKDYILRCGLFLW